MTLGIHHMICDGRSLAIIGKQLADAYNNKSLLFSNEIWYQNFYKNSDRFWEEYLEDYIIPTQITDENVQLLGKNEAGYIETDITFISKNELSDFTKKYNCSLFHILVAAYVHVFRMINDQDDVIIGTTVANRDHKNIDVVGMYANTIPLRFKTEFSSIKKTLEYTTEQILSAMEYQNSSLTSIIEKVVKHRDGVSTPIFQHVINLLNTSMDQLPVMDGLSTKMTTLKGKYAQFHQSWIFSETSTGIALTLEYNKRRYSGYNAHTYIDFFKRTLYNIIKKETMGSFRTVLNISLNDTPHSIDMGTIFSSQTKLTPRNIMLENTNTQINYRDGYRQVTARANYIRDKVMKHYGEAVHLLGCAYLSISPDNPIEMIRSIILGSGSKLCIIDQSIEEIPLLFVTCGQKYEILNEYKIRRYAVNYNISYLIYTSGTTGTPSGVCINNQSVINMLENATQRYNFRSEGRILQFTKSSFDASISNTFGALLNGGTIILSNRNEDLIENVASKQPLSVVHMTPVLMDMLNDDDIQRCSEVETWSYGGESISQITMNRMLYHGKRLIQLYGPTETTCYLTSLYMKRGHSNNCLGPTITNLSFGLCSFAKYELQRQQIGQLYCSGENLARGYMGDPVKSLRSFPNNPYKTREDVVLNRRKRIYLVGDRIRVDKSNYLHFLGRKDNQVKVKGHRIELEEIEAIICKVPGVKNCVAVIQKDKVQANHIVLFYIGGDQETVKKEVNVRLPSYMTPTKIIQINEFPITTNGKINRKTLSLRCDLTLDKVEYQPLTQLQSNTLEIFRNFLNTENFALDSNFFQYGGHSLLAVRLAHILSDRLNVDITPVKLFEFPTVKELVLWIENQDSSDRQQKQKIKQEEIIIYELPSPLQTSLLRAFKNKSIQQMYTTGICIEVNSDIPFTKILEVINTIVMIHPSLRTAFTRKKTEYRAEIWSGTESYHTLEYCKTPNINVFNKPPFYAVDGHSMNLISNDINRLLKNGIDNVKVDNYFHFNSWLSNNMDNKKEMNIKYWKEQLSSYLRTDYPRLNIPDHSCSTANFKIDRFIETLDFLAKLNRCSPFVIAVTALTKALRIHSIDPSQNFGVGFPFNIRNDDFNNTVAYGINSLMVIDSGTNIYPNDLQTISRQVTGAMAHALITFEDIQSLSPSGKLFCVMLIFDNYSIYDTEHFKVKQSNDSATKFEISIFIDPTLDTIKIDYMASLYRESTIGNIVKTFNEELKKIISGTKQIYVPEKNESVIVSDKIIYDVNDVIKILVKLPLGDVEYRIVNNSTIEISYVANTNMDSFIIKALQALPLPLRTITLIYKQVNITLPSVNFPLSPQQQQMYYLSQVNSPSGYTLPFIKEFPKSIKPSHLQHSLLYIIQYHQSLRTMFLESRGEPRQVILSMTEAYIQLNIIRTDDIIAILKNLLKQPILLEDGPPIKAILIEEKEKFIALLQLHHIISDACTANYRYVDYCIELEQNPTVEPDTDYLKSLALTPTFRFENTSGEVLTTEFDIPITIIERGSKHFRTSPFVIIVKALSDSLMEYFKVSSVNIGLPFSNRCSKTKSVVGYFLNNLVLHLHKSSRPIAECLREIHENINKRMEQNIPFYKLVSMIRKWSRRFSEPFYTYVNCRYDLESTEPQDDNLTSLINMKTEFPIEVDVDKYPSMFRIALRSNTMNTAEIKLLTDILHKSLVSTVTESAGIYRQYPVQDCSLQKIIHIASEVLKTKSISKNDNFFSAGGNSLQAILFSELVEEYFNIDIDVSEIYQMDSFLNFTQRVEDLGGNLSMNIIKNYETDKREQIEHINFRRTDEINYTQCTPEELFRNVSLKKSTDIPFHSLPWLLHTCLKKTNNIVIKLPQHLDIRFKEAEIKVIQMAHYLRNLYATLNGELIRPDTIIPVISRNSVTTILNCLSVIMSGGAYLPIDSTNPIKRIQFLLEECNATCYIGQELTGIDHKQLDLTQTEHYPRNFYKINAPKDLAYVIYTSGTTGNPKGVCAIQEGVVNMITTSTYDFQITPFDVIYQFTNFAFDNSVLEIFMAFANSACLLLDLLPFSPKRFIKQISEYGISHCLLFPGIVSTFKRELFSELCKLRYWIVGAEKLPRNLFNMAIEFGINVIQNYGPTEMTAYALTKHMKFGDDPQNLGKSILNSSKILEFGKKGELLLKGLGLMRGYLNQDKNSLWYPTGDIVQILPNDDIIFIGRNDNQVKIRAHRVELGEIENIILRIKEVTHCVVIWKEEEQQLTAFCITTEKLEDEIMHECVKRLPSFMVPNQVECMAEFPLTVNSKIDVSRLSNTKDKNKNNDEPSSSCQKPITSTVVCTSCKENFNMQFTPNVTILPRKTTASKLRQVWARILQFEDFSSNDHFFLVGGNSMLLIRLRHELYKEFRSNLTITQLLKNLIFNDMVILLNEYNTISNTIAIIHKALTATHTLVFIHSLYGGSSTYSNLIHSLKMLGNFTILAIENKSNFPIRKSSNYESLTTLYMHGNVVLIGASFGGTLAFEVSQYLNVTCKVIAIDSGTDYDSIKKISYAYHSKEVLRTLRSYDIDEPTKQSILSDSWNMLQLLKDYTPLRSRNISEMHLLSIDGSDLGWRKLKKSMKGGKECENSCYFIFLSSALFCQMYNFFLTRLKFMLYFVKVSNEIGSRSQYENRQDVRDRWNIVYIIFLLHGVGMLMSWNMFITIAPQYYVNYWFTENGNKTKYAASFMSIIGVTSQIPNVGIMFINMYHQYHIYISIHLKNSILYIYISFYDIRKRTNMFFLPYYKYHMAIGRSAREENDAEHPSLRQYWECFTHCWVQLFNNFFVYFISLIIFPAMMSDTPYYQSSPSDKWGSILPENLYFAINTFLNFNVFASVGSLAANYVQWPKPRWLWVPVIARVLFIPFFMLCNYQPSGIRNLPVIFKSEWWFTIGGSIMALTCGYLSSLALIYTPRYFFCKIRTFCRIKIWLLYSSVVPVSYQKISGMAAAIALMLGKSNFNF
uniref:Carrier domain-containing protein n=1 Tax=Heterorhabditis bacteriophora TaxID=37862 RepID=A0A1I7WU35_HETBA